MLDIEGHLLEDSLVLTYLRLGFTLLQEGLKHLLNMTWQCKQLIQLLSWFAVLLAQGRPQFDSTYHCISIYLTSMLLEPQPGALPQQGSNDIWNNWYALERSDIMGAFQHRVQSLLTKHLCFNKAVFNARLSQISTGTLQQYLNLVQHAHHAMYIRKCNWFSHQDISDCVEDALITEYWNDWLGWVKLTTDTGNFEVICGQLHSQLQGRGS